MTVFQLNDWLLLVYRAFVIVEVQMQNDDMADTS